MVSEEDDRVIPCLAVLLKIRNQHHYSGLHGSTMCMN